MNHQDEQRQAADALAMVEQHQERTRQAGRVPWWAYLAMFLLTAGGIASTDFVDLTGVKAMAIVILVVGVVVVGLSVRSRSSLLSRMRGVQSRQEFVPRAFFVVAVLFGAAVWLLSSRGTAIGQHLADAVGLHNYPNTALGIVFGIAFTGLFALGRLMVESAQRRRFR